MATRRFFRHITSYPANSGRKISYLVNASLLGGGLALLTTAGIVLWWSRDLPDPQKIEARQIAQSTKIFDRTGTHLLYEIGEVHRTAIPFDRISSFVKQATLAAEDDQFYQHYGLDALGILRAVFVNLRGGSLQGGSTITQQLIKNSILTPERTLRRKVKEAVLALELEQRFSKDEILSMYLNEIPYGSQTYGVEAAAQAFFGKPAADVTLAEAAILAALPRAPSYYSPYGSHFEDLKRRQEHILERMASLNMLSQEQATAARQEELHFQPRAEAIRAPHFVFYVKEQVDSEYGERVVEQGGLKITTTLDMRLQKIAEEELLKRQEALKSLGASNAALVAIDPKTGDILAMVGSIDYFNEEIDGNVNVTVRHRSPGSSIKPFIYATAWQHGYTPNTILVDAVTDFGQGYKPENYNLQEHGPVTMRVALANSLNIPAVQTLYLAGVKEATQLAQRMGMDSLNNPDRYGLSLVLGGGEVRLLDLTSAYGVFANDGVRHPHRAILKVENGSETLLDTTTKEPQGEEIISAQLARMITDVLSDNQARATIFGTGSPLQLGSRPVAAKTGTAQDFRDGWAAGYTPSLVVGVWTGNNDNSPMGSRADGVRTAAPIWNSFMRQALDSTPIEQFVDPQQLEDIPHGVLRGELPEIKGKWEATTNILYTNECPIAVGIPKTVKELHSILFYVRRTNPRGPPPADPQLDPQFSRWEAAVAAWREKHNEKTRDDPTQPRYVETVPLPLCEIGNQEDVPKVRIVEPDATILHESPITVKVEVDSPQPLQEVRFLLDGDEIARRTPNDPYIASFSFPSNFSGRKTLLVLAVTKEKLIGRAHRTFIINPDDSPPSVTLHTPQNGKHITAPQFPLTVKVTATDANSIELVDVLYRKEGQTSSQRIGRTTTLSPSAQNRYEVMWADSPGPGTYEVYVTAYDKTGNFTESSRNTVIIE